MKAREYLSNVVILVYRECFYGEPFLGALTGITFQLPQRHNFPARHSKILRYT